MSEPVDGEVAAPVSRLEQIRALCAERSFEPLAVVIDEIKRKPSKSSLDAAERAKYSLDVERLMLDYEKLELAKAGGGRGVRARVGADGSLTVDMFENWTEAELDQAIADEQRYLADPSAGT